MKKIILPLIFILLATITNLHAQEAWLLEMPHKYSDYLISKSTAEDYDAVESVLSRIPTLIENKQIREIEKITWKAEEGKHHPNGTLEIGNRKLVIGSRYRSAAGTKLTYRLLTIKSAPTEYDITLNTSGPLSRTWTPTFVHKKEKFSILLLERHSESDTATTSLSHHRSLTFDLSPGSESATWFSSEKFDNVDLTYQNVAKHTANDKINIGTRFFSVIKPESKSLLRMEIFREKANSKEKMQVHHNQASFSGIEQTTGPLQLEIVNIADKKYEKSETTATWTLSTK